MYDISFVIPCYNSQDTIGKVIEEIHSTMSMRPSLSYEIIAINDCSKDNTLNELKNIIKTDNSVKIIDLAINAGKHAAVLAGYTIVNSKLIVNLDDDGQCPMNELWKLVDSISNDCDIAIAKYLEKKQSRFKNSGSRLNDLMLTKMLGKPKNLSLSNFSVLKRFVVDNILKYKNSFPYLDGLFLKSSAKIKNVKMNERNRISGKSNFTLKKSVSLFMNGFTSFSVKPLRVAWIVGLIEFFVSMALAIFMIIAKFTINNFSIVPCLVIFVVCLLSGITSMMLGMLGEYIGRLSLSVNSTPQYVIKEIITNKNDDK